MMEKCLTRLRLMSRRNSGQGSNGARQIVLSGHCERPRPAVIRGCARLLIGLAGPFVCGCSFLFTTAPPPSAERAPRGRHRDTPAKSVDCTTSPVAPTIDLIVAGYQVLRTGYAAAADSSAYNGAVLSRGADFFLGLSLAALFTTSAVYGYTVNDDCIAAQRRAKARNAAISGRQVPTPLPPRRAAPPHQELVLDAGMAHKERECEEGVAESCTDFGIAYSAGELVPKDDARAVEFFEKGCNRGHALACRRLALAASFGRGLTQDSLYAASLFLKACDGGDAEGCTALASFYSTGTGVAKDDVRAAELLELGCDGGHATACRRLGACYSAGQGVSKDDLRARELFEKACKGGDTDACELSEP